MQFSRDTWARVCREAEDWVAIWVSRDAAAVIRSLSMENSKPQKKVVRQEELGSWRRR